MILTIMLEIKFLSWFLYQILTMRISWFCGFKTKGNHISLSDSPENNAMRAKSENLKNLEVVKEIWRRKPTKTAWIATVIIVGSMVTWKIHASNYTDIRIGTRISKSKNSSKFHSNFADTPLWQGSQIYDWKELKRKQHCQFLIFRQFCSTTTQSICECSLSRALGCSHSYSSLY